MLVRPEGSKRAFFSLRARSWMGTPYWRGAEGRGRAGGASGGGAPPGGGGGGGMAPENL